ncbi:hypothetical protein CK203_027489 [Vitis vinifera]|uniref:RNase H type-1 domain-containing protein n=1 Tax=Vitis vinifera TaxID=29760 RepID=A0A438JBG3_VITVI|nr:hypothetical protein CK203_027489 [Vitis vinifera]
MHLWSDFGKLLGHMVSERSIEVDLDKIKAILDMPVPRTEKEIRGFLGILQYISRFIAKLTSILSPMSGHPLLLYLSVSDMALGDIQGDWKTKDVKLRSYHAYLELLVRRFDDLRYTHLPKAQNQFVDALATLASSVDFLIGVVIHPLPIESRSGTYLEATIAKDRRALR